MRRIIVVLLAAGGLGACNAAASDISQAPPGIAYRVTGGDLAATTERADRYCQDYGQRAHLSGVQTTGSDRIATYDCR